MQLYDIWECWIMFIVSVLRNQYTLFKSICRFYKGFGYFVTPLLLVYVLELGQLS